jgi:hypothetical protein
MSSYYEILKNLGMTLIVYPTIFIIIVLLLTVIFSFIYSQIYEVKFDRTIMEIFLLYQDLIFSFLIIIYKILTIPYQLIKIIIDVFEKFKIIFYFIINIFNGFTSFVYDVTSLEI